MLEVEKIISVVIIRAPLVCVLFLATVGALLPVSAHGQKVKKPAAPAKGPFSGEWDTRAGGYKFTVKLTQTGNKVTGTYTPYNGKIFAGVVTGNKVTFKWTQDGGGEGTGEFTLNADRKGFTGSSTMIKPTPQTNAWNTYVPEPPQSFAGTWDMVNNVGVRVPLSIVQQGAKVTGFYPARNGTLEGTVDGRQLRFKWESDEGSGSGQAKVSASGQTFSVTFEKDNGQEVAGSPWWGDRVSEIAFGFGGKKLGAYGGTWIVNESGPKGAMELKQSGTDVTGVYKTAKGIFDFQDAKVSGTILRFVLIPRNAANSVRAGELRVDGKSFNGTIDGISVTGTLKNP